MRASASECDQIRAKGWRQGDVLPPELVARLIGDGQIPQPPLPRDRTGAGICGAVRSIGYLLSERKRQRKTIRIDSELWLVLSQDCDLVHDSFQREPFVELLRFQLCTEDEGAGNRWGKSPRKYSFEESNGNGRISYIASIHDRVLVDRRYLAEYSPSRNIGSEQVRRIARWVSQRYVRAAFPDEFVRRISKAVNKTRDKLKNKADLVTGIYVLVEDVEHPVDRDYGIVIWFAMREEDFQVSEKRNVAQTVVDLVEAAFGGSDGIVVEAAELRSEADISLDDLLRLRRWDFDDLTLRSGSVSGLSG
jgi:hypothetical protein